MNLSRRIERLERLERADQDARAANLRRGAIRETYQWLHEMGEIANDPNPEESAMDLTAACLEVTPDEILAALGAKE